MSIYLHLQTNFLRCRFDITFLSINMSEPSGFQAQQALLHKDPNFIDQKTDAIERIFTSIAPCVDYYKCISDPNFWILFSKIQQSNQGETLRRNLNNFFRCINCKETRGFKLSCGCLICETCKDCNCHRELSPDEIESKKNLECLKCFTIKPLIQFNTSQCFHFCNSCLGKDLAKNKAYCKICKKQYKNSMSIKKNCDKCNEMMNIYDLVELSCFHSLCKLCKKATQVKGKKISKCSVCENTLNAQDIYKITKGSVEKCMICLRMVEIEKISRIISPEIDMCIECEEHRFY